MLIPNDSRNPVGGSDEPLSTGFFCAHKARADGAAFWRGFIYHFTHEEVFKAFKGGFYLLFMAGTVPPIIYLKKVVNSYCNLKIIKYVCGMEELKKKIEASGLLKGFIAEKVGISSAHLSMMLSGSATMPEEVRNKINTILLQAAKIAV